MTHTQLFAVSVLVALLAPGASSHAGEQKIERSQLPPAVEKTLAEQSKDATIRHLEKESEGRKIRYEAELTIGGHRRDVVMDESGAVLEIEDEIALEALPPAVKEGLQTAAGSGRIVKVEMITKAGKISSYEASVKTGKKRSEIEVDPDGKPRAK